MKILILDPYEFDSTSSEESLIIAIADDEQFSNYTGFYKATSESEEDYFPYSQIISNQLPVEFDDKNHGLILSYLKKYINYEPSKNAIYRFFVDEWNESDILIEDEGIYIRCYWETTA
ncbi:MAG: hypothetical protein GY714_14460 [Desulfobacterales bacterium]|nr:hypothetical protein [Desulfobacterales bacterium]